MTTGNVYAANGVGAVLAEQGNLLAAREIFTEVKITTSFCVCRPTLASVRPGPGLRRKQQHFACGLRMKR